MDLHPAEFLLCNNLHYKVTNRRKVMGFHCLYNINEKMLRAVAMILNLWPDTKKRAM